MDSEMNGKLGMNQDRIKHIDVSIEELHKAVEEVEKQTYISNEKIKELDNGSKSMLEKLLDQERDI